jgi:hypothetical protein
MFGEYQVLLHDLLLHAQQLDMWQWQRDPVRGYSVFNAFQLLTSQQHVTLDAVEELVWHKQVPLKVSVLHGDSCDTGCQQKQIWQLEPSSLLNLSFVCPDTVVVNRFNTYSSLVTLLVRFVC